MQVRNYNKREVLPVGLLQGSMWKIISNGTVPEWIRNASKVRQDSDKTATRNSGRNVRVVGASWE